MRHFAISVISFASALEALICLLATTRNLKNDKKKNLQYFGMSRFYFFLQKVAAYDVRLETEGQLLTEDFKHVHIL